MAQASLTPLPPTDAIAALARRGQRLDPTFSWQDAWQDEHAKMFTVAKSAGFDVLSDIHAALVQALAEGRTFRDFAKDLTPVLQAKGWWGKQTVTDPATGEVQERVLGSTRRLRTIFDTNMRVSYAAGHWAHFERHRASRPVLRYVGILDGRIRPAHRARHNLCLPVGDPYWDTWAPPCGWGCRCTLQSLSLRDVERMRSELKFTPPAETTRPFTNRRTGEVVRVPDGIDPGWAYNPGKAAWRAPPMSDKLSVAPPELAAAAKTIGLGAEPEAPPTPEVPQEEIVVRDLTQSDSIPEPGTPERAFHDGMVRAANVFGSKARMRIVYAYGKPRDIVIAPGRKGDFIQREVHLPAGPNAVRSVDHALFILEEESRGVAAKQFLARSIEAYAHLDIDHVTVHANIDVGGYAWLKYGFVPNEASGAGLAAYAMRKLDKLKRTGEVDEPTYDLVRRLLAARDFQATADLRLPVRISGEGQRQALGKYLFLGSDWHGILDLRNRIVMARFFAYVGSKT